MSNRAKRTAGVAGVVFLISVPVVAVTMHWVNVHGRASALQCAHNLRRLALAIAAFHADTGHYPPGERPLTESLRKYVDTKDIFSCPCRREGDAVGYDTCYCVVDRPNDQQLYRLECPDHGRPGSVALQVASGVRDALSGFMLPGAEAAPAASTAGGLDTSFVSLASDGLIEVRRPPSASGCNVLFAPECFLKGDVNRPPDFCPAPTSCIVGLAGNALSFAAWDCADTLCQEVTVLHGGARIVPDRSPQPRTLMPGESVFFLP